MWVCGKTDAAEMLLSPREIWNAKNEKQLSFLK